MATKNRVFSISTATIIFSFKTHIFFYYYYHHYFTIICLPTRHLSLSHHVDVGRKSFRHVKCDVFSAVFYSLQVWLDNEQCALY